MILEDNSFLEMADCWPVHTPPIEPPEGLDWLFHDQSILCIAQWHLYLHIVLEECCNVIWTGDTSKKKLTPILRTSQCSVMFSKRLAVRSNDSSFQIPCGPYIFWPFSLIVNGWYVIFMERFIWPSLAALLVNFTFTWEVDYTIQYIMYRFLGDLNVRVAPSSRNPDTGLATYNSIHNWVRISLIWFS